MSLARLAGHLLSRPTVVTRGAPTPIHNTWDITAAFKIFKPSCWEMAAPGAGDPYTLLGVPRDAAPADIRKAYFRLARRVHQPQLAVPVGTEAPQPTVHVDEGREVVAAVDGRRGGIAEGQRRRRPVQQVQRARDVERPDVVLRHVRVHRRVEARLVCGRLVRARHAAREGVQPVRNERRKLADGHVFDVRDGYLEDFCKMLDGANEYHSMDGSEFVSVAPMDALYVGRRGPRKRISAR